MEYLNDAKKQLKRLDHSVYVSLKYTRTVDVLRSIITRMIDTLTPLLDTLLTKAKEDGKITDIPKNIPLKCKKIRQTYSDHEKIDEINEMLDFLMFLRKVRRNEDYESINEYRRHVALITEVDGQEVEINLDITHENYDKTKHYIDLVEEVVFGKKEEDYLL
jgi:hypothetical protein